MSVGEICDLLPGCMTEECKAALSSIQGTTTLMSMHTGSKPAVAGVGSFILQLCSLSA